MEKDLMLSELKQLNELNGELHNLRHEPSLNYEEFSAKFRLIETLFKENNFPFKVDLKEFYQESLDSAPIEEEISYDEYSNYDYDMSY